MSRFRFTARRVCILVFALALAAGAASPAFAQKSDVGGSTQTPPQFQSPFGDPAQPGEAADFDYLVSLFDKIKAAGDRLDNAHACGNADDIKKAQAWLDKWWKDYDAAKKYYINHYNDVRTPSDAIRDYDKIHIYPPERERYVVDMAVVRASKYKHSGVADCGPKAAAPIPPAGPHPLPPVNPPPAGAANLPPCDDGNTAGKIAEAENELSRQIAARDRIKRVLDNDKKQLDTAVNAFGEHDARSEALRKAVGADETSLKAAEGRITEIKSSIEALRALKSCPPQSGAVPQPPATPEPGAPGLPPCNDGTLAKKIAEAESTLRVETEALERMDERLHNDIHQLNVAKGAFGEDSPQYEKLSHNYGLDLDKWIHIHARQQDAQKLLEGLRALKACPAKKHKHRAVTEDDPHYMEDYQPPVTTPKPSGHDESGHASRPPPYGASPEDDDNRNQDRSHSPYNAVPDVPNDTHNTTPDVPKDTPPHGHSLSE